MDDPPLEVLCEDGPVLAVNKPAGLLTQGVPRGVPTLEAQVRGYLKAKYEKPGNVYLGIPHRLDRETSGVIVFARNSKAAARLGEQFHDRKVKKEYLAVVSAIPAEREATLTDWLRNEPDRAHVSVVEAGSDGAKEAVLRYRVLAERGGRALLGIEPLTGRTHQIRVQLAARGWPVLGDAQYGSAEVMPGDEEAGRAGATALHARRLTILHPVRYEPLAITAPLPAEWSRLGFDESLG